MFLTTAHTYTHMYMQLLGMTVVLNTSTHCSVHTDGEMALSIAAFSAGRPNKSHPIG